MSKPRIGLSLEEVDSAQTYIDGASLSRNQSPSNRANKQSDSSSQSIDPNKALNNIKNYTDVLNGNKPKAVVARISPELSVRIKESTGVDVKPNAPAELNRAGAIHMEKRHGKRSKDLNPLDDNAIGAMSYVIENPDAIKRGKTVDGAPRIRMEKRIDQNRIAVVEVIKKGDSTQVVTYFNDSPSGRPDSLAKSNRQDIRAKRDQSTNLQSSIADDNANVNLKDQTGGGHNPFGKKPKVDPWNPLSKKLESIRVQMSS